MFKALVRLDLEKDPCQNAGIRPRSAALEAEAVTTRPSFCAVTLGDGS